jgi:hypothetical protein
VIRECGWIGRKPIRISERRELVGVSTVLMLMCSNEEWGIGGCGIWVEVRERFWRYECLVVDMGV